MTDSVLNLNSFFGFANHDRILHTTRRDSASDFPRLFMCSGFQSVWTLILSYLTLSYLTFSHLCSIFISADIPSLPEVSIGSGFLMPSSALKISRNLERTKFISAFYFNSGPIPSKTHAGIAIPIPILSIKIETMETRSPFFSLVHYTKRCNLVSFIFSQLKYCQTLLRLGSAMIWVKIF